jgi:hypothetical protein
MQFQQLDTQYADDDLKLFATLTKLGLVNSQFDFSRRLGRNATYFSVMRSRRQPVSVAALASLAAYLRSQAQSTTELTRHVQLHSLAEAVSEQLFKRSQLPRPALRSVTPA